MRVGIIGAGNIGAALASRLVLAGYETAMANSRGPHTLSDVAARTGARAAALDEVGRCVQALILAVPQRAVPYIRADVFAQAPFVIDTNNYYPWRDGSIDALDAGLPDSSWVAQHVRRPVVKVFNSIQSNSLMHFGRAAGSPDRIALPLSGDDSAVLHAAATLVDAVGFDPIIAGDLASSWRQQPGSPVYCTDVDSRQLKRLLALAMRDRLPSLRDEAIHVFRSMTPPPTPEQRREIFRRLYLPAQ